MANNEAGIITKQKLINSAKELFYKKGYTKTTLKEICENAEIPRSILFYYFRDKSDIAGFISNDINNRYFGYINEEIETKHYSKNIIIKSSTAMISFFLSIMSDANKLRFYAELLCDNQVRLPGEAFYQSFFRTLYKACKKNTNSKDFMFFFIHNVYSVGPFLYKYMIGDLPATKEDIVGFFLDGVLKDLSIEREKRIIIINKAFKLCKQLDIQFKGIFFETKISK